jgi:hypothetical protein
MALLAGKYACYNIYQAADGRFPALGGAGTEVLVGILRGRRLRALN